MRSLQLGFPRRYGEDGLSAEENAKEEQFEELGAVVTRNCAVDNVVANSGIAGDEVSVVLCEIDSYELRKGYEGIEEVAICSSDQMCELINTGDINNGFTLSGRALFDAARLVKLL